jgi:tRNA-splicing ligase RtcB (3'-phosphate/5'-hydroxy nucleic acid ligase)
LDILSGFAGRGAHSAWKGIFMMKIIDGIPVFGEADPGALSQIKTCAQTADRVALMADNHKGYAVPIGGVVAYKDAISPSGVGYDIGCGNKAVRLDIPLSAMKLVKDDMSLIMDQVWKSISFGLGRKNAEQVDHELFDDNTWKLSAISGLKEMARDQLGTVGSGNHYVDVFEDERGRPWIGVHFGSRGFGHKTASYFLDAAGAKDGMDVPPCVIPTDTYIGSDYIAAMTLAGKYAYAGRDWVCKKVAEIIGAPIIEEIHNHHNFAWLEEHEGEKLWVVRKGATPAWPGQQGFVGGSMAEPAVIIEGVEAPENKLALYSTIHGAGRVMGRMEAKGKFNRKTGVQTRLGRVTNAMMASWLTNSGVELRGGGLDESPDCYKRLPDVLAAQGSGIKVLHTLTPLGVAMAGADEFDPFKD